MAEANNETIAGGWFFRDGNSIFYWLGIMKYAFKAYFPYYAILNHAIRLASSEGMNFFNMGASGRVATLEEFKAYWAAEKVPHWRFVWQSPVWSSVSRFRGRITW